MTLVVAARPPAPVPASVTPLQARRALRAAGMIAAVEAYVATLPAEAREEWEYAVEIERASPLIEAARTALQLAVADMDDLFRLAATL